MNEASIIAGCITGDRKAQKILFEHYSKGMLMLCRRYVKDEHNAEDMVVKGFYKFFATISRFEYTGPSSTGGWLKKIMINECLLFLRDKKNIAFANETSAAETVIEDNVIEKMSAAEIIQIINTLPDGYRLVFNMYVIEGYNHREIAELLQITEGTSKSQLSKARMLLQRSLQKGEILYEK